MLHAPLAIFDGNQFDLGARQVARGGDDRQTLGRRFQNEIPRVDVVAGEGFVERSAGRTLTLQANAAGGVSLRVAVDQQHVLAFEGESGGQVNCRGGLSDPAFLICDGNNLRHINNLRLFYAV